MQPWAARDHHRKVGDGSGGILIAGHGVGTRPGAWFVDLPLKHKPAVALRKTRLFDGGSNDDQWWRSGFLRSWRFLAWIWENFFRALRVLQRSSDNMNNSTNKA